MTRAENHTKVSHAPFSDLMSSQVSTLVSSSTDRPMRPVVVAFKLMLEPAIHRTRMSTKTQIILISFAEMGPISFNFSVAILEASGFP